MAGAALRRLGPRDQEILQLAAWDGLDIAGLATVLECSPGAAAMRLHRARTRLEKLLHVGGRVSEASAFDGAETGTLAADPDADGSASEGDW